MAPFVVGSDKVLDALFEAGVIQNPPCEIRRVVIDLQAMHVATIYVELHPDQEKLAAALGAGIEVVA